ncbi:MAG: ABC transporter substrate-binding protein [Acidimicrobiales bacterium]
MPNGVLAKMRSLNTSLTRTVGRIVAVSLSVAILAASCGSDDSEPSSGSGESALDAVYSELEGLDLDERRARLLELAEAEDENLQLYTIVNLDDTAVYAQGFTEETGIDVEVFRARGGELLQRVLEENAADQLGFDVLMVSSPEMIIIDAEEILHRLDTPYTDEIVPSTVNPNWSGVYLNVFLAAWNTDLLSEEARPTSWEQVLTGYPDAVALEAGDFDWFATLVQEYFVDRLGYTEEEAIELFRVAVDHGRVIDGHTTLAELLGAGEFDVVTSAYQHGIDRFANNGSPIAWEPAVEPLVLRETGIGIRHDTPAPATALLFVDFMLSSQGQDLLASVFRTPANVTVAGGVDQELDILTIDVEQLNLEREKWEGLYEEIIRGN